MIHAIALDDERPALEVIDAFCSRVDYIDLQMVFTSTNKAQAYLDSHRVDLIFLDINMPAESGLTFFRSIRQSTMVIFTTAYSDYAVESYELQAIDYLLKPFSFARFKQAVDKADREHQRLGQSVSSSQPDSSPVHLFFRVDYGLVKVAIADILFIEGLDNYLKIHLHHQKPVVVRLTMKAMLEKLPPKGFVRTHRSYIVSLDKVQGVRNKLITIGDEEIPLSSSYESGFNNMLKGDNGL